MRPAATATFNVGAPANVNLSAISGSTEILSANLNGVTTPVLAVAGISTGPTSQIGIRFTASPPTQSVVGSYKFVQVLSNYTLKCLTTSGSHTAPLFQGTALDNANPYSNQPTATTAEDTPTTPLASGWTELETTFSATMYLMWDPGLPNSIRIPLASLGWRWAGDGINTLTPQSDSTNWTLNCGTGSADSACHVISPSDPNNGFPTWGTVFTNGSFSCP